MAAGLGFMEMLFLALFGSGGQPIDLAGQLSPQDYFKAHGIEISIDKLVELAGKDPKDGASQMAQLLALRSLGEDEAFKKSPGYQGQRKLIEDIAAGKKAQDKLGFAKEYAQRTLAQLDGAKPPTPAEFPGRADGLAWFPPAATFAVGIEFKPTPFVGVSKKIGDELLSKMPEEMKKEIYKAIDVLGNVEFKRFTFAYVEDANREQSKIFMRFTGRLQHDWFCELLKTTAGMQGIEKKERAGVAVSMLNFNPGRPPAMALVGDHDFVIAGFEGNNNNHADLIEQMLVHREKKDANAATGNLKAELNKIPAKAVGFLVGTLPAEPRNHFQQMMGAFPKKVSGYMERIPTGLDLVLEGGLDNDNEAKSFIQSAGKLRTDAMTALQNNLQNAPPGINLDALRNLLNSMQFEPKGANVHMRMLVSDDALMTVPYFFLGRAVAVPAPPKN
jgi:hypothetical protein